MMRVTGVHLLFCWFYIPYLIFSPVPSEQRSRHIPKFFDNTAFNSISFNIQENFQTFFEFFLLSSVAKDFYLVDDNKVSS